jgi:hypothetical protein
VSIERSSLPHAPAAIDNEQMIDERLRMTLGANGVVIGCRKVTAPT